ncbi:uncharacterized protein LOC127853697 [Dreissena polymorpha]|uniref:Methyltransferase type 11 domain-containing protein n=1 Tax=Dreissena polymorpha TaxID=45954 RepID=A0A9D4CLD0_DREPO|nr:uncharacterized protein LOC127853697 [Dreissena polymorpha]KAH3726779.1 hypothetical protein DPMN_052648 [Dreissena polymorpha]
MSDVHPTARDGFQQGAHYDLHRPSYTDEIVKYTISRLLHTNNEGVKYTVLELGAGTGLFTRKMLQNLPREVTYLATDPSVGFLSVLREHSPDVTTAVCQATQIPLPDSSVENILCAQCFHWFATEAALQEMTRVLVPGGRIMLLYNNKLYKSVQWMTQMEAILDEYYDHTPRKFSGQWRETMESSPLVRFVEHKFMDGLPDMKGDKNFVVDHFTSISVIAKLTGTEFEGAVKKFHRILDEHFPGEDDIVMPLDSEFYCVEKC